MGLYSKNSFDLVCEQINRDNPGFPIKFTPNNVILLKGPLVTELGTSGRNTRAIFNGVTGSGILGKVTVYYDRLDLTKFYNKVDTGLVDVPTGAYSIADVLELVNDEYGLKLELSDLASPSTIFPPGQSEGSLGIVIAATSLAYTGTLTIKWKRALGALYPESGPGNKRLLFGDIDCGYFGRVEASEVLTMYGMYSGLYANVDAGTEPGAVKPFGATAGREFYFKFAYKGRFLFIPNTPDLYFKTWREFYRLGIAYGLDDDDFVLTGLTETVGQITTVLGTDKTSWFHPRLVKMSDTTSVPVNNTTEALASLGGDFKNLLRKCFTIAGVVYSGIWDTVSTAQLAPTQLVWTSNVDTKSGSDVMLTVGDVTNAPNLRLVARPNVANATAESNTLLALELVNSNEVLLPITGIDGRIYGKQPDPGLTATFVPPEGGIMVGLINISGDAPFPGTVVALKPNDQIVLAQNIEWDTSGTVPDVTITVV